MSRGYWGNNIRVGLIDQSTQSQILSGASGSWDSEIQSAVEGIDSPLVDDQSLLLIVQAKEQGSKT